ncbi:MAG: DUF3619 family protein [Burkholderiales bacterium]|nr:DUF3619 family protein [Burkholderiales bacterium]MCE7876290.1 DUF3619 family protein [Betaproteobacteria bacterium PRO3]
MTADEREIARKITSYLDAGAAGLKPGTIHRLGRAREAALARLAEPRHAEVFALAGTGGAAGGTRPFYARASVWVGVVLIAAAVFGWQQYRVWQTIHEAEEIDAQLLASDLPYDAYLDRGFQNWLKTAAQH